jgi:2-C-methyl-D-erythritol 4-phosphate cytidylyltransferase
LLIEGNEDNFKITTPADLARFEFMLSKRQT